ncbi:MAG: ABC transporter permease subunit, partial [Candidatus Izimaplasma sp.]|nr:ABC transporter permease subunit [Candidatus Izimaplasma bacterium]
MSNKRRRVDRLYQGITFFASSIAVIVLSLIFIFVFRNGSDLLDFGLLVNDYHAKYYNANIDEPISYSNTERPDSLNDDTYYSEKWGIAFEDGIDREGKNNITVVFIAEDSPFQTLNDKNNDTADSFGIEKGNIVTAIKFEDKNSALPIYGAEYMINELENSDGFREIVFTSLGGGIRGSIITTLYVIGMSLLFSLPIGIFTAIYLNEFARKNPFTNTLRSMIEVLTGVPSIIFGLMGLAVFVPLTVRYTSATSGNLISGSLTLGVILLPVIIRATEESLKVVPDAYRFASLALGANHTQTTFKVVLPN